MSIHTENEVSDLLKKANQLIDERALLIPQMITIDDDEFEAVKAKIKELSRLIGILFDAHDIINKK